MTTIQRDLQDKRVLVVLDNCEHLIHAAAQFAQSVMRGCPEVCILATSRELLGAAGERAFNVPSLSTPEAREPISLASLSEFEAVQLFVERARTVSPEFALREQNAPAVAQICRQLDGIPLALELAAARLRMLTVEQIAARLDNVFRLLTGGVRTALPRHQTLEALIDWSYDLLPDPERVLFRRLAVFAGGWTLEAAEAVCAGDAVPAEQVLDLMGHLIDKSLVQVQEQGNAARFRLLATIRQYAMSKLAASGEADAVRQRHASFFLTLVDRPNSNSGFSAWLDDIISNSGFSALMGRMETERDNIRAAVAWSQSIAGNAELGLHLAIALTLVSANRGYWDEARELLEGALGHANAERMENTRLRGRALRRLGFIHTAQGNYATGEAYYAASLKLFQELGDIAASALLSSRLGWAARERGDAITARLRLQESLATLRALGDKTNITIVLTTLGEVFVMEEDVAGATRILDEGLALARELANPDHIGWALNHLGHVAQIEGEFERATRLHMESIPFFEKVGLRWFGIIWAHQGLGETALAQGDTALAVTHLAKALELFRNLGDRMGMAWCLAGLAGVAALDEEPERAAWLWGAAEHLRQSIGARHAPASRATRERLQTEVRKQLGEDAFNAKWNAGQAVSVEQAVAEALEL